MLYVKQASLVPAGMTRPCKEVSLSTSCNRHPASALTVLFLGLTLIPFICVQILEADNSESFVMESETKEKEKEKEKGKTKTEKDDKKQAKKEEKERKKKEKLEAKELKNLPWRDQ